MYLERITSPEDIKSYTPAARAALAEEMRAALIRRTSICGGHIAPNLGIIEATIALHTVFDSPQDKIIFDVSHQCYPHKMLTGRAGAYINEAEYGDVSGFTNTDESVHDIFNIGHTSTAVSLATGLAKARDLAGRTENIIAVVGDGSMSGGEALEGLNVAGEMHSNLIIVFNDNDWSISENHGGMYEKFRALRETGGSAPDNLFRAMNLDYRFVADGNDTEELIRVFSEVKDTKVPVVVHIVTQKGKGLSFAEDDPEGWHRHKPFHLDTGTAKSPETPGAYDAATVDFVLRTARENPNFVYLSAGIVGGIGLTPENRAALGAQYVDVGIAEEHAVAMASGLARGGARPIFGTYSTFFQRVYDQMAQDVCINRSPAVFLATGTSLYRSTDVTHLGFYDISIFSNIPNLVYLAPASIEEHLAVLAWAVRQTEHPVMIRMPFSGYAKSPYPVRADYADLNKYEVVTRGEDVALIGVGNFAAMASDAAAMLAREGIRATVVNPLYLSGLDTSLLDSLGKKHRLILTLEDGILAGGFGQKIAAYYGNHPAVRVRNYGLPKKFFNRYNPAELARKYHLTAEQIAADVLKERRRL
ncbi:putative 1-deoxy-D-xylulose-5-phosphate synthase [Selenomonas sp. oral taxon 137 str. F0430]|uniref:1-deoxy-D-xylulose-5-phosphate synthase n=1 Tax=Selenomonas sp. oral taxon 137 TaxID=712531 RepID=UPI0001EB2113|nr:1-deoxy-D-xylulose-5-phosphate synthase [Selenomonas sp. oral taxon 137]EFR39856.1 putative 1-deoxy-D-xylulose-5-phosphate synthase [Selenomonas sp. oral taxon 137 str. F0430]